MVKSTISMVISNSYVKLPEGNQWIWGYSFFRQTHMTQRAVACWNGIWHYENPAKTGYCFTTDGSDDHAIVWVFDPPIKAANRN